MDANSATTTTTPGPNSKKSNRPLLSDNKRTVQIRLAQRAYRERKENRIKELEDRLNFLLQQQQQLQEQPQIPTQLSCPNCQQLKIKQSQCEIKIRILEQQVIDLQSSSRLNPQIKRESTIELHQYNGPNDASSAELNGRVYPRPSPDLDSDLDSMLESMSHAHPNPSQSSYPMLSCESMGNVGERDVNMADVSGGFIVEPATSKFGKPNIEPWRTKLKQLPSLKDCKWLDVYLDSFLLQAEYTDTRMIRHLVMKILNAKYKMLDCCSIMDRFTALEVIEAGKAANRVYLDYMFEAARSASTYSGSFDSTTLYSPAASSIVSDSLTAVGSDPSEPSSKTFRDATKQIPSLSSEESQKAVDDLCNIYAAQAKSTDLREREYMFFQMISIKNSLADMCKTEEDKHSFMLAIEVSREKPENKKRTGKMLEDLQQHLAECERQDNV
ncbi:UNVERIFIED_CONTAM: hypothetical protein HDU68_005774 [Siphonaria sp. JEL0065]|nr:hypothetical protein HDU68_005774 [Siphonaria sp. JEL0065]